MAGESFHWTVEDGTPDLEPLRSRVKEAAMRSPRYVRLAANMVRDDRVPNRAKAALIVGGAYVVSPIDLVPGFIPVLGQMDDLIVIIAALGSARHLCPPDLVDEHMARANLTHPEMDRDFETAELSVRWVARKGIDTARVLVGHGLRVVGNVATRGISRVEQMREPH